ncbi:8449_t:CDS:2 [Cetraspora pellucida]|uniref:8449_t:CDS:1 n=1 Tax=Cetraspora pellucida TaxID=1433469 RepID=A0A9N9H2H1_9GLOM|nr:8449_t:CDS:2 [Cetraspora pellucida]
MASTILPDIVDPLNPDHEEELLSYSQPPRFFNSDDKESDIDVDYMYAPFGRPPSRLGNHSDSMGSGSKKSRRKSSTTSLTRLKVDNSFLKNQNIKLLLELEHSRLTIQALKNIVNQKESTLQSYRNENQKAILKIRVLEALIFSKHAKDGSIIIRSSGGGSVNENGLSTNDKIGIKADNKVDNIDKKIKHQRRWSIDFGPRSHLNPDDDVLPDDNADITLSQHSSRRRHSISPTSSSTVCADNTANDSKSRGGMPRLIKFKTGDIIQTLASCRPTSTKNGYDFSPPSTPIPFDKNEISDDDNGEESDVDEVCENLDGNSIDEKLQRQRRLGQGLLSKIFSSSTFPSSITITPAARGSLSR